MIPSPLRPLSHPDADIDCQEALEIEFQALAEKAEAAGWKGGQVARALLALAMAHIKARMGMEEVARAIRAVRETVGEH